ncbi:MAG TPA: SCO family protein [Anaerolineales bacterium]|nr:SCO family protein [Anaerolineales bacterium]HNA88358.1 SCO family protein [Anaerolineales bacterium]HNB35975.1 SCO family protein [Anaerolineales bacterium]HNC07696.1 SCO family protein [Anaerolineales bacterium]
MNKYILNTVYGLGALIVISALAFKIFQPIQVLPRMQLAPAFRLVDQDNQPLTSEDLRGQFVIYTFTYTNCPEPCYNINETVKEIESRLDEVELDNIPVTFVTLSFDPERDTPEVLNAYANSVGADTAWWKFATTPNQSLLKTIIGAGLETYYEKKEDGSFAFDPAFVLVDGLGIVRAEYRYSTEVANADRILRHLGVLADEVRNSSGTNKLAYEAAHLFLCYAP